MDFKHGASDGANQASELINEYGNVILYKTDRFNLLDRGREWLSTTPTTTSRVEGSDYTRTFVWAKLQDKRTGEIFVFVNTHLDYVGATYNEDDTLKYNPRLTQTEILLSRTAEKFGDLPIIYTADWNFGQGTDAYQHMNSKGYYATETIMENAYKPAGTIDACFVDSNRFVAVDYRYINSHDFGEDVDFYSQVSDHPAILTEIALVKRANQIPLPGEIVTEGPFDSEEDLDGFN